MAVSENGFNMEDYATKSAPDNQIVEYTVLLTVRRPVVYDNDESLEEMAEWRVSRQAKRELERELGIVLRKLDGDCDLEVDTAVIKSE